MSGDVRAQARSYGRATGLLTAALASAGILAYLFFAVASHSLGEEDYGQIVVLWSAAFLAVSVLFRPVEQLLAKTVAEHEEHDEPTSHALQVAATIQLAIGAVFSALAIGFKGPIEDALFDGEALYFWVLVATVVALSASYFARGFFAGSRRMGAYAALLVVEGLVRLGLALIVAVGISEGTAPVAIAIVAAPVASLLVVPFAVLKSGRHQASSLPESAAPAVAIEGAPEFTLAKGSGFAAAVLLIMLSEQILLNGGVLIVQASEGTAAAGFIFNVLMVVRAPVVLFAAVAASLLPHLTRLRSRGDETSDSAFELSIKVTVAAIAGFALIVALGLATIGPSAMQLAFGENFTYDRAGLLIVALGMGLYMVAATLNQAALARGEASRAAACWLGSAAIFGGVSLLPALDAFRRVEIGFTVSAGALCAALLYLYLNPRSSQKGLEPDSPQELEARLATANDLL